VRGKKKNISSEVLPTSRLQLLKTKMEQKDYKTYKISLRLTP